VTGHVETDRRTVIQALNEGLEFMRYKLTDDEWTSIKPMLRE
jgi:hypothetical protein